MGFLRKLGRAEQGLGGEKKKKKEGFEWELEGRGIPCCCDCTELRHQGGPAGLE